MIIKWIFDRVVSLIGLLCLWPILLIIAILVKIKEPGGPILFRQKRIGFGIGVLANAAPKAITRPTSPKTSTLTSSITKLAKGRT